MMMIIIANFETETTIIYLYEIERPKKDTPDRHHQQAQQDYHFDLLDYAEI